MFKGFYELTSGMLSQTRNLNVISNNMVNTMTPGYKKDRYLSSTFREVLMSRSGNRDKSNKDELGETTSAMINASDLVSIDYSIGSVDQTDSKLDFALTKNGFFQIQTENGVLYTRNGSFITDDEGYLSLPNQGRVLGQNGEIQLNSDDIQVDTSGAIYTADGLYIDTLAIVDFPDYTQLRKTGEGLFQGAGDATPVEDAVMWKALELSNVSAIEEMSDMISSQRALQSSAQLLKMYDEIISRASTDLGRI